MGARGAQPAVFCSCPGYQGDWEAIKFEIVSGNINHTLINQENVLCRPVPVPGQPHSSSCYLLPEHWCLGSPQVDVEGTEMGGAGTVGMAISRESRPKSRESSRESRGPSCESPLQNL